jgi:hypothetical protein
MTWILQLNDMREPHSEVLRAVCRADTVEQLMELLVRERVETYETPRDPTFCVNWVKSFRQGGPLEWFNPPDYDELAALIDRGFLVQVDIEARVRFYRRRIEHELATIPHIGLTVSGEDVRAPELTAGAE